MISLVIARSPYLKTVVGLVVGAYFSSTAFACSCVSMPTLEETVSTHDRILVVKLKKYRNLFFKTKYRLNVTEVLKGNEKPRLKPIVQGYTSCDPTLENQQEWVLFLNEKDKEVQLGWCLPHTQLKYFDEYHANWREIIE